jgi:hypothetical protein
MPLPAAALAALNALPTAEQEAAAACIGTPDRIVDAYMHGRPLPRNDAQLKRMLKEQRRQQQLNELEQRPVHERYGIRFNSKAGQWVMYLDNVPTCTSTDLRALQLAYPDVLHQHLVDALKQTLGDSND